MSRPVAASAVLMFLASTAFAADAPVTAMPVTTIVIDTAHGPRTFCAEIAADPASQERGLMFRRTMAPFAGMIFDFHKPDWETFWMKNTILSLDMVFIRQDGTISSIAPNAVPYSETPIPSAEPVRAVLEINAGRAVALGIEPGDRTHNVIFGNALPAQHPITVAAGNALPALDRCLRDTQGATSHRR
jgi:uncharacterized membrane protein (UPF0127 family)